MKFWVFAVSPEMDPGHTLLVVMKLKSEVAKVQMFVLHWKREQFSLPHFLNDLSKNKQKSDI